MRIFNYFTNPHCNAHYKYLRAKRAATGDIQDNTEILKHEDFYGSKASAKAQKAVCTYVSKYAALTTPQWQ